MYGYVALGLVLMAACGGGAFKAWAALSNKGILEPSSSTFASGEVAMATTDACSVGGV